MKTLRACTGTALFLLMLLNLSSCQEILKNSRSETSFNNDWKFLLSEDDYSAPDVSDSNWRQLNLPHDWSIEGNFSADHPAGVGGGALPGGIGWYRKTFSLPAEDSTNNFFIHFDGVYWNSSVYLNGHLIGYRPNGYISFRYDITPYLNFGDEENVFAVKVDNSNQPNSRWYSGSGIYRNVWLVRTGDVFLDHQGTYITTPVIEKDRADINTEVLVHNLSGNRKRLKVVMKVFSSSNAVVAQGTESVEIPSGKKKKVSVDVTVMDPALWSVDHPELYRMNIAVFKRGQIIDETDTPFGIRYFRFDKEKGFFLNDEPLKILGVCNHHDLGCLGTAVNRRAIERQLRLLKGMGCNAIRTAHNPPAPELLDLCDKMGFLVMDETFDMWKKKKSKFDYSQYWNEWHEKDLRDHILRDRNHPSVILWSIGNEILEQWDSTGTEMTRELYNIVQSIDTTRPVVTGNNHPFPDNNLLQAGVMDIVGYNYKHSDFENFPEVFPAKKFIATETTSGLMTRGKYDMPSDSIRRWPYRWDRPFEDGNADHTVSAYDNVSTPWGSTHEESWSLIKKHDFLSGMFIWTGFDYLGEPTPYGWPSRSAYFGIFDLAGFPKDVYYMYKSEWTDEPVLHVFPHWNWEAGEDVDVWAYTNCTEVDLYLNDSFMGSRYNNDTTFHLMWRLNFEPGKLRAVGILPDGDTIESVVETAGEAYRLVVDADRKKINADGSDLTYVEVNVVDEKGVIVPYADSEITFEVVGDAKVIATDNGSQTDHTSFQATTRNAFNGKCLAVVQTGTTLGDFTVKASSPGLEGGEVVITAR